MEHAVRKLARALDIDVGLARGLMEAGYVTENRVKNADKKDLQEVPGIGPATAKKLTEKK
jgi:DNA uptake protein ComE-like DNA-binding protein